MKNYTRTTKQKYAPLSRNNKNPGKAWVFPTVCKMLVIIAVLFVGVTARIYFNEKTVVLNNESNSIKTEIRKLDLQKTNLRNKKEELSSWPVIREKIRKYNLALRETNPTQTTRVKLIDTETFNAGIPNSYAAAAPTMGMESETAVRSVSMR